MMIDEDLWLKIREVIPTVCVDLVILNKDEQFLLCKRKENPAKNQWWIPGGRIFKDESILECAIRKGKEEVGLDIQIDKFLSIEESMLEGVHTINIVLLAHYEGEQKVRLNKTQSAYRWFDNIQKDLNLHANVLHPLVVAGFKVPE